MLDVAVGSAVTIPITFLDGSAPAAVTTPVVTVVDANGTTQGTNLTPTYLGSAGQYRLVFTVSPTAALGTWRAIYSGMEGVKPLGGQFLFTVSGLSSAYVATPDDIQTYTQKTFSEGEIAFCQQAIAMLQGEMETYLGRSLTIQQFDEVANLEDAQTRLFLKNTPVLNITSVTVAPNTTSPVLLDPQTYIVKTWGLILADPTYSLLFRANAQQYFGTEEGTQVEVVYQGGIDGPNIECIRSAIIRATAREYLAMASDAQNLSVLRAGMMLQYTFTDQNVGGFTDNELAKCKRYKRRMVS